MTDVVLKNTFDDYKTLTEEEYLKTQAFNTQWFIQPEHNLNKNAIVCDIDGVLNHITPDGVFQKDGSFRKGMFELVKSQNDMPKRRIFDILLRSYTQGCRIIFLTYRSEEQRLITDNFITQHWSLPYSLFMLPKNHPVTAPDFKYSTVKDMIIPTYNVIAFLDDSLPNCQAVSELGIPVHLIDQN